MQSTPWAKRFKVSHSSWVRHNCTQPIIPIRPSDRNCTKPTPPIPVHPQTNVDLCFHFSTIEGFFLGKSDCTKLVVSLSSATEGLALPEQAHLVCGNSAYSCVPKIGTTLKKPVTGTCYLAYLIAVIRQADPRELAPYHIRDKHTISMASRIPSIVIPAYGVYKSQEEIAVLSTVLERHMNKTTIALSAMQPELTDIRGMVLQNRMALDLILASQGGVCKVLGWECCSYISDASSAVHDVVADTERGIQELHEDHDWNPFGEMQSWTGSWGASLVKVLAWVVGVLILIMIVIALMVFISRACVKKAVTALVSSPDPGLLDMTLLPDWIPPYAESDGSDNKSDSSV